MIRPLDACTPRELEALRLAAEGHSNVEISLVLGVSLSTAKTYLREASWKLGARNRAHAAAIAVQIGLFEIGLEVADARG
jgi:DNA-binding CsgD family transcriptional regulator